MIAVVLTFEDYDAAKMFFKENNIRKKDGLLNVYIDESIDEDEIIDSLSAGRHPGLPCTTEEFVASCRRGEEDRKAGRGYTTEEVRAMFQKRFQSEEEGE